MRALLKMASALLLTGLTACWTPPPAPFESVARSGVKFAGSVPPLLDTVLNEAISANSATLVMAHATASEDARRTALLEADQAYRSAARSSPTSAPTPGCSRRISWRWERWPTPAATARSVARRKAWSTRWGH